MLQAATQDQCGSYLENTKNMMYHKRTKQTAQSNDPSK